MDWYKQDNLTWYFVASSLLENLVEGMMSIVALPMPWGIDREALGFDLQCIYPVF